jgi:hypothetical protein
MKELMLQLIQKRDFIEHSLMTKLNQLKAEPIDWKRAELRRDIKVIREELQRQSILLKKVG